MKTLLTHKRERESVCVCVCVCVVSSFSFPKRMSMKLFIFVFLFSSILSFSLQVIAEQNKSHTLNEPTAQDSSLQNQIIDRDINEVNEKLKEMGKLQYAFFNGAKKSIFFNQFGHFKFFISFVNDSKVLDWLLHYAASKAKNPKFIEALLVRGAHMNVLLSGANYSPPSTPLHEAIKGRKVDNLATLLAAGANPNIQVKGVGTTLHMAVNRNSVESLAHLVDHPKIDMNARNKLGQTALHAFAQRGSLTNDPSKIGDLLLFGKKKVDIEARDYLGRTALREALPNPETLKFLLNAGADPNVVNNKGNTLLHSIITERHRTIASDASLTKSLTELLSHKSINANIQDSKGRTALHIAASAALAPPSTSTYFSIEKITGILLANNKVDPTVRDNNGQTVLHFIAKSGSVKNLRRFLKKTKDLVNRADRQGSTPLHEAVKSTYPELLFEKVKILIAAGADVNAKAEYIGNKKVTPLELLYERQAYHTENKNKNIKSAAILLIKNGAKIPKHMDEKITSSLFTEISDLIELKRLKEALEEAMGCYN